MRYEVEGKAKDSVPQRPPNYQSMALCMLAYKSWRIGGMTGVCVSYSESRKASHPSNTKYKYFFPKQVPRIKELNPSNYKSALVRIRIRYFLSMRIRIRIQIQGFDDQILEQNLQLTFFRYIFLIKNCNLLIPRPP